MPGKAVNGVGVGGGAVAVIAFIVGVGVMKTGVGGAGVGVNSGVEVACGVLVGAIVLGVFVVRTATVATSKLSSEDGSTLVAVQAENKSVKRKKSKGK